MEKQKKQYIQEFKIKAVELIKHRSSLAEVAKELNMSRHTLINWQRLNRKGKLEANGSIATTKLKSKEELENTRLKKELYDMKMERDILKKAVSIFSKSDK